MPDLIKLHLIALAIQFVVGSIFVIWFLYYERKGYAEAYSYVRGIVAKLRGELIDAKATIACQKQEIEKR